MCRDCLATPLPFSAGTEQPMVAVPAGACDCHVHVYDSRFPAAPGARLLPPDAPARDYGRLQQRIGTTRTVLVTPSTYGTDNRCMLEGLAALGAQARGVAVIDGSESDAELQRLAGPNSLIGLPTYTHEGVEYTREWGTEQGQTELVPMTEHVVNVDESYTINHHSMLYARETGLTDRRELLLFSVEQDEEGTVSLSTSLGISLYTTDLSTI